ncbi:MAG TPA: CBS domain-containing protein [Candidatus Acidoferrales bacterium]|nr:CBS domain-containing protein [Candidatus Acidoferrales bacterium]
MSLTTLPKYVEEFKLQPIAPMISKLIEVPPESSLWKIVGQFKEKGVYEIFFAEGARCSMISERSLLRSANLETVKPSALTSYVPPLPKEALVADAARLMSDHRIRSAPVSDGHKILGQVDCTTLLRGLSGKIGSELRISSLATINPVTIEAEGSGAKARELMVRKRIDHLPVVQNKREVGVLTSSQLVSRIAPIERVGSKSMKPQLKGALDFPVKEVMDDNPLTYPPEARAEQALESLLKADKTCVTVLQWEELQGITTQRDFMALLTEKETEPEVPVFIVGLPDDPFESETTKTKFKRAINQLHLVYPDIIEARSVIKTKAKAGNERARYEVNVQIRTPGNSYTYSEEGWELAGIYDLITDRLKRLMTNKQKPHKKHEREGR